MTDTRSHQCLFKPHLQQVTVLFNQHIKQIKQTPTLHPSADCKNCHGCDLIIWSVLSVELFCNISIRDAYFCPGWTWLLLFTGCDAAESLFLQRHHQVNILSSCVMDFFKQRAAELQNLCRTSKFVLAINLQRRRFSGQFAWRFICMLYYVLYVTSVTLFFFPFYLFCLFCYWSILVIYYCCDKQISPSAGH